MAYEARVDVLVTYAEELRSPSVTWKAPAVIRQRRTRGSRQRRVTFSRRNVLLRDRLRCQYCGTTLPESELTLDHVVPRCQGGRRVWENLVTACRPCNRRKAHHSCDEAGMFPLRAPAVPESLPVLEPGFDVARAPEEWRPFLQPST
jgi:5-methylcytosine-specific restriction endonuclease McrA